MTVKNYSFKINTSKNFEIIDITSKINELIEIDNLITDKFSYQHDRIDNNARSHLKSFLLSSSECLPIKNSKLDLGTWQSVFFVELDGPRANRTVTLTMVGE